MDQKIREAKKESFRTLIGNKKVFPVFREILTESYVECCRGKKKEMKNLLDNTFNILFESRVSDKKFELAIKHIILDIFRKGDDGFWFNRVYKNYKMKVKPQKRYRILAKLVKGKNVLDVGCGDGLLSVELEKNGFKTYMTDVIDVRNKKAEKLLFEKMKSPTKLPFENKIADTSVLFAVLHHIDSKNLGKVLDELKRVSHRIIIEEDCYDIPNKDTFKKVIQRDKQLQKFMKLSRPDQFRYLMLLDYFSNALAQGIPQMNFPFEFKTIPEWHAIFEKHGLSTNKTLLLGFQKGNFNRVPHVWFVLDVKK